jgi:RNA polymerase sigma factor (sigma-70 family)
MPLVKSSLMVSDKTKSQLGQLLTQLVCTPHDEQAWESLYSAVRSFVWSIAYRSLSGNSDLARDATQDTFFRLFRYVDFSLFQTPAQFLSYLATVARHAAQDVRRKVIEVPLDPNLSPRFRSAEYPSVVRDRLALVQVLQGLEESERHLVRLLSEGRNIAEIANELQINRSAADVRIFRLRAKLRKLLKQ